MLLLHHSLIQYFVVFVAFAFTFINLISFATHKVVTVIRPKAMISTGLLRCQKILLLTKSFLILRNCTAPISEVLSHQLMTQNILDFPPLEFLNHFDKFYTIFPKSTEDNENNHTMNKMLFVFSLSNNTCKSQ